MISETDISDKAEQLCTAFEKSLESTKEQLMDILKYLETLIINLCDKLRSCRFPKQKISFSLIFKNHSIFALALKST